MYIYIKSKGPKIYESVHRNNSHDKWYDWWPNSGAANTSHVRWHSA